MRATTVITQPALQRNAEHRRFVIEAHPIIQTFVEKLRIPEIIAAYIKQDKRMTLPVEKTLTVLIHNILTTPMAMYELGDWLAPLDEQSVGLDASAALGFYLDDDRMGRALERLCKGRHKDVFFHLALRAIKVFELDCSQIHQDTTSVTFSGKYSGSSLPHRITHGHNKDHRPDLKQLVLGLSATADGFVPLTHQVYDGNQADDQVHMEAHRRLRKLLERADFIYVADCKLASSENLRRLAACGGRFVSTMPRTWSEDKAFRKSVQRGQAHWELLLTRKNSRKPDSKVDKYYIAKGAYQAKGYRLLWIRSTQKEEQDAEVREQRIEKAVESLRSIQARLNTYTLKTSRSIERAITAVLREHQVHRFIGYQIKGTRVYERHYKGRGRPKPGEKGRLTWKLVFSLSFDVDEIAIAEEATTDGIFPVITNLENGDYDDKRVLEIYKYQPFLEKRHSQLKTYQEITPVFLKKNERVIGYLHMHVMALMVATLMERKLRKAMKSNEIESLPIYPENRPCPYPTTFDIVRVFRGVERYEVIEGDRVTVFPAKLNPLQRQLLSLLEVPESLYH